MESFIASLEERAAPLERAADEAWWRLETTGTGEARAEAVRAARAHDELFADPAAFEKIVRWYGERSSIERPVLRRQVEVLHAEFAARQGDRRLLGRVEELEAEAGAIFGNHRGTVDGRKIGDNEIRQILRFSEDEDERRAAWEASRSVGREVEGVVRELARLRNRLAREQGYENHYERALRLQEIEPLWLEETMRRLQEATEAPFRRLREKMDAETRRRFGTGETRPWHLPDPFFQEPPEDPDLDVDRYLQGRKIEELALATYDAMGLDVRGVLARSDLYERPGKSQHAFCISIGREYPYDVRVLANLRPDAYWMETLLHELGHAAYDRNINPSLPYFLRSVAHTSTTEAIALMMGALATEAGWLSSIAGAEEAVRDQKKLEERERAARLVFVRWALVMYRFERELYADPDRDDLNELWWDLVEELQLVKRPEGRREHDWAAKIHLAVSPVYYHNYVLGHLIAAQLRHHLETYVTRGPFYESRSAGLYLVEALFGPGARESWRATVERATGEPPDTTRFVEALG
nr:M2 family metallopeptidase [Rubrobacter calidifluminis]